METVFNDETRLREAVEKGEANMRDMTSIIKSSLQDMLPPHFHGMLQATPSLIDTYLTVEKSISPIPWIDTRNVVFLELSPKIVSSQKTVAKERLKFSKAGFPSAEFDDVLKAAKSEVKARVLKDKSYTQKESIIFCWIKPEDDHGVLCTEMDHQYAKIYSISTDMPFTASQRQQNTYYKSVLSLLLKEVPIHMHTRRIQFAYLIEGQRLALFLSVQ